MNQSTPTNNDLLPCRVEIDRARYEIPHHSPFVCEITIDNEQLSDVIEHVNNVQYLRWLDRAAQLHSDSLEYTRTNLLDQNMMWFVARHEIDYLGEVWLGDKLLIATWVRDFKRIKSWRDYVIIRPTDETIVCRAATLWVLVELASRRPRRIPPEMIQAFDPVLPFDANGNLSPYNESQE